MLMHASLSIMKFSIRSVSHRVSHRYGDTLHLKLNCKWFIIKNQKKKSLTAKKKKKKKDWHQTIPPSLTDSVLCIMKSPFLNFFADWELFLILNHELLAVRFCSMLKYCLKDLGTRFSKQALLFQMSGFKNCKFELQCVPLSVGHFEIYF